MPYRVVFTPEAARLLEALFFHVATATSTATAQRFTNAIVTTCERLALFPHRGTPRKTSGPVCVSAITAAARSSRTRWTRAHDKSRSLGCSMAVRTTHLPCKTIMKTTREALAKAVMRTQTS
jgi:plasmid stabilization system protein ParE